MPQYQAVASNTSGSTPKDLFETILEDLEKQVRSYPSCYGGFLKTVHNDYFINFYCSMKLECYCYALLYFCV